MHEAAGNHSFVQNSLTHVSDQLNENTPEIRKAIGQALGTADIDIIEAQRSHWAQFLQQAKEVVRSEPLHGDQHFVSRFDAVGLFQSVLAKVFCNIPDLQGYGNKNPSWLTTLLEEGEYRVHVFFQKVYKMFMETKSRFYIRFSRSCTSSGMKKHLIRLVLPIRYRSSTIPLLSF